VLRVATGGVGKWFTWSMEEIGDDLITARKMKDEIQISKLRGWARRERFTEV
jgi:hypothetical protein